MNEKQNGNTSKIHYCLEAKIVVRDKSLPLTARYLLNLVVSILGLEEEAKVLVCTRKQQSVLRVGTNRNGVKLCWIPYSQPSVAGLEGKVASD